MPKECFVKRRFYEEVITLLLEYSKVSCASNECDEVKELVVTIEPYVRYSRLGERV